MGDARLPRIATAWAKERLWKKIALISRHSALVPLWVELGRLGCALVRRALSGRPPLPLHEQPAHQHDEHCAAHLHEMLRNLVAGGVSAKRPKDIEIGKLLEVGVCDGV